MLFIAAGSAAGYLLYLLIGFPEGTHAISSNPYSTSMLMGFVGWLISVSV